MTPPGKVQFLLVMNIMHIHVRFQQDFSEMLDVPLFFSLRML